MRRLLTAEPQMPASAPGARTNSENVLCDREAGFTAGYMGRLLITDSGIEPLSSRPRTLTVIGS